MGTVIERWGLFATDRDPLLGAPGEARTLTDDQLVRVSLLTEINRSLPVPHSAPLVDRWVNRANSNALFGAARRSPR